MNATKALVSALAAALTVVVAQGADILPPWLLLICAAAVAGLATYTVPPGPGVRTPRPGRRREGGYGAIELAIAAVVLVILLVILVRLVG